MMGCLMRKVNVVCAHTICVQKTALYIKKKKKMVKISDFDVLMGFKCLQINNGKFSEEEATKIAQTYYGTNESMMKKAKDLIGICSKKGKRNNNATVLATEIDHEVQNLILMSHRDYFRGSTIFAGRFSAFSYHGF